jgi:hypothetical protein
LHAALLGLLGNNFGGACFADAGFPRQRSNAASTVLRSRQQVAQYLELTLAANEAHRRWRTGGVAGAVA